MYVYVTYQPTEDISWLFDFSYTFLGQMLVFGCDYAIFYLVIACSYVLHFPVYPIIVSCSKNGRSHGRENVT